MAKILIFGDIMGRPGRNGISQVLPMWRETYAPDVVIANIENLAHGKGVTMNTMAEMEALGIDAYTSGNHVFDTGPHAKECFENYDKLIRPNNYVSLTEGDRESSVPGRGFYRFAKNDQQYLVMNFNGRVFFEKQFRGEMVNPFFDFDKVYKQEAQKDDIIIVDLHAEVTSEKNAFGWYLDGRATVVYGTHTHIPTADTKIFPKGTAFQTDMGMTGAKDSILGVIPENSLNIFLETGRMKMEMPESGPVVVNALFVETEGNKPIKIERLQKEVNM